MSTLAPGEAVDGSGRYVLESRIATGGMGEVWAGRDTVLGRSVAIKVLKTEYADDPLFRQRFETEARHAAGLQHPGIAAVFDFGESDVDDGSTTPRPYLVMELVEGQPLSALLRPDAPLDAAAAAALLAQAADALGQAHAAGIVHRDVKPANLLVTPDRRIKVTDFGIARATEGMALTETGQVLGTPAYISPEQAEGRTATPASDVYSLGVVAFECLAGRKPFVADTPVATALAHLRQPVPELPSQVPADLAAVVRRALDKSPDERFPDGAALARALRDPASVAGAATVAAPVVAPVSGESTQVMPAASPEPRPAPTPAPTPRQARGRRTPWPLLIGLLAVAAAVLLAVWLGSRGDGTTDTGADRQGQDPTRSASREPSRSPSDTPSDTPSETPTETPSETPSETPTETPTEEPTTVEVDPAAYVGRDHKDVEKELRDLGLEPVPAELENPGDQQDGIVESVEPSGTLEEGTPVTVSFWGKVPPGQGPGGPGAAPGKQENQEGGSTR